MHVVSHCNPEISGQNNCVARLKTPSVNILSFRKGEAQTALPNFRCGRTTEVKSTIKELVRPPQETKDSVYLADLFFHMLGEFKFALP